MAGRVGFIGLGTMGQPMALRLLGQFPELSVCDPHNAPARARLEQAGARVAGSARSLAGCETVILCLPDSQAVRQVVLGALAGPGVRTIVDCSTTDPQLPAELSKLLPATVQFIDAPVTGERARAERGELTAMVGGSIRGFEVAEAVLAPMASCRVHMGQAGAGQLAKALNNSLYNVNCAAMGEVLALAARSGLDTRQLARVVSQGSGQSFGWDKFVPLVHQRQFGAPEFGYPMGKAQKDMEAVARAVERYGAGGALRVLEATSATYDEALCKGLGAEHKGAMVKVYEAKLGVTVDGAAGP